MIEHTDPAQVTGARVTATPTYGRTVSGYGGKIPTRYMVRLASDSGSAVSRWHRVYAMVYGNAGTAYVRRAGVDYVLDPSTEAWLEDVGAWADRVGSPVTADRPGGSVVGIVRA